MSHLIRDAMVTMQADERCISRTFECRLRRPTMLLTTNPWSFSATQDEGDRFRYVVSLAQNEKGFV